MKKRKTWECLGAILCNDSAAAAATVLCISPAAYWLISYLDIFRMQPVLASMIAARRAQDQYVWKMQLNLKTKKRTSIGAYNDLLA